MDELVDVELEEEPKQNGTPIPEEVIETEDEADARSTIFQMHDLRKERVYVKDWKMYFDVQCLTGEQRAQLLQASAKGRVEFRKMYPDLVIMTARHIVTGKLIFKPADREELLKKSGGALETLALCAARISGITPEEQTQARKN